MPDAPNYGNACIRQNVIRIQRGYVNIFYYDRYFRKRLRFESVFFKQINRIFVIVSRHAASLTEIA